MFAVSNTVVYPGFGVAKISREITKEVNGSKLIFYELKFLNKDIRVLIPKDGFSGIGVRKLSTKKEIVEVFDIFCLPFDDDWIEKISIVSWNRRSKDYQNKIKNGNIKDLAYIYRDLKYIEKKKALSFGEKTIISQVEFLLAEEFSIMLEKKKLDDVVLELRRYCERCIEGKGKEEKEKFISYFLEYINNNLNIGEENIFK